jgi:hypothetical protein
MRARGSSVGPLRGDGGSEDLAENVDERVQGRKGGKRVALCRARGMQV